MEPISAPRGTLRRSARHTHPADTPTHRPNPVTPMRIPFAAAAAAFLLCVCTPPAPAQMPRGLLARPTLAEAIDSIALQARAEQAIPGLSIAVVKDGRVVA